MIVEFLTVRTEFTSDVKVLYSFFKSCQICFDKRYIRAEQVSVIMPEIKYLFISKPEPVFIQSL